MPNYSPLPNIELDPRNEGELVQAAARRVYEASNATLNDFSSGSPIVALLEGQAFAQAEFLQFANQFPESVLVEWIGPFLGAQRRTGSGSVVDITFNITPRDDQFDVFAGYQLTTDPNLTGGEAVTFVTTERLIIPPGQSTGVVSAVSVFKNTDANVPPNTITRSVTSLAGVVSVNNEQAAAGGQDPELLSEVKERFFSLIRRRNPVSSEDWVDFFSDALGPGASVTVLPRRSEKGTYRYEDDYVSAAPAVSFFVLNPDGTPITNAQKGALENLIRWSLPVEFIGYVYPMEVNDVDFHIGLKYDPTKPYAQDLTTLSMAVRDNAFKVMQPNAVFPISYDQSVTDVEGALASTFPITLGTTNQYLDPDIDFIKAYVPPKQISSSSFIVSTPKPMETGEVVQKGDLVVEQGNSLPTYYKALESFTPELNDKTYHVNVGNLDVKLIRKLENGEYNTGDVISIGILGELHVVLTNFTYRGIRTIDELISGGLISNAKGYSLWGEGGEYSPTDENGKYDPQLFIYEQGDTNFNLYIPPTPVDTAANRRPGAAIYVVNRDFTTPLNTTSLGGAQNAGLVGTDRVTVEILEDGQSYTQGQYIKTPDPSELLTGDINLENCYIDQLAGAIEVYAEVIRDFNFNVAGDYVSSIADLVEDGALKVIQLIPFVNCEGESSFSSKPFRYSARFRAGEYVRFRASGGYDAVELEECTKAAAECTSVTENCTKLFQQNLDLPRYFFVLKDFTPNTSDISSLIEQEVIEEVDGGVFEATFTAYIPSTQDVYSNDITASLLQSGIIGSVNDLSSGDTCLIIGDVKEVRGLYEWKNSLWILQAPGLPSYRDLFRFAPGDVATFRSVSETRSYIATDHVTPILDLETYFDNGLFERTSLSQTVSWIDSDYHIEDVIEHNVDGAVSFYRATRSFTPSPEKTVWNGVVVNNTPRIEEIFGNTIKFVNLVECSEAINARVRDGASTVKLGTCQIDLVSKSIGSVTNKFVWEATQHKAQVAALSAYPLSTFSYGPVNYGTGTLAL